MMLLTGKPLQLYTTAYSSSLADFSLGIIEKNTRHGPGVWPQVSLVYRIDEGYGTEGQSDAHPGQYIYNLFLQLLGAGKSKEVYNTKTLNPWYFDIIRRQLRYMLADGSLYRKTEDRFLKNVMSFRESPGDFRATAELLYQTQIYPKGSLVSARQLLKQSDVYKTSDYEAYSKVALREVQKRALPESGTLIGMFSRPGQGKSASVINASLYTEVPEDRQIWEQVPGLFIYRQFKLPQMEKAYRIHFKKYSEIPEHSIANILRMISGGNETPGRREDFKHAAASGGRVLSRPYGMGLNLNTSGRVYNKDVFNNSRLLLSLKQQTLAGNLTNILNDMMYKKLSLQRIPAIMQDVAAIPADRIKAYVLSEALREGSISHGSPGADSVYDAVVNTLYNNEEDAVNTNIFSRTAVIRLHGNITGISMLGGEVLKTAFSLKKKMLLFFGGTAAARAEQSGYRGGHAPDLHHAGEGTLRKIFGGEGTAGRIFNSEGIAGRIFNSEGIAGRIFNSEGIAGRILGGEGNVGRIFGGESKNYGDNYINLYTGINLRHSEAYGFLTKTDRSDGIVRNLFRRVIEKSESVIAKIMGSRFVPDRNRYIYFTETNKSDNIIAGNIIHLNYLRGALYSGYYTRAGAGRDKKGIKRTDMFASPIISAYPPSGRKGIRRTGVSASPITVVYPSADRKDSRRADMPALPITSAYLTADMKDGRRTGVAGIGNRLQQNIYIFLKSIGAYYRQNEIRDTGKADSYSGILYAGKYWSNSGDITDSSFYYTIANHKIIDHALHLVNVRNAGNLRRELEAGGTFNKRKIFTPRKEAAYKPEKALRAYAGKPLEGRIAGIPVADKRENGKTPLMNRIADTRSMYYVISSKLSSVLLRHRDEGMRLLMDGSTGSAVDRIHVGSGSRTGTESHAEDTNRNWSGMNTGGGSFTYIDSHTEINRYMQRWLRIITGWNKMQRRAFSYTTAKESSLFTDKYVKTGYVPQMIRNMRGKAPIHLHEPVGNGLNLVPTRLKPAVGMRDTANAGFATKLFTKGAVLVTSRAPAILQERKSGQAAGKQEIFEAKAAKLVNLRDYTDDAGKNTQEGSYIRQMPTISHRKSQIARDRQSGRPKSLNQPAKSELMSEMTAVKVKKFTDEDIRDVANKVYREIEQRLKYERRSKGL